MGQVRKMDKVRLGNNIYAALNRRGMKANDLAKELGSSIVIVSRWINGYSMPSSEKLIEIGRVLHTSLDVLTDGVVDSDYCSRRYKAMSELDITRLELENFIRAYEISKVASPDYWGNDDERALQMFYRIRSILERSEVK